MNFKNYICVHQRVLNAYALFLYIKFVKLLRVLSFYICIRWHRNNVNIYAQLLTLYADLANVHHEVKA